MSKVINMDKRTETINKRIRYDVIDSILADIRNSPILKETIEELDTFMNGRYDMKKILFNTW